MLSEQYAKNFMIYFSIAMHNVVLVDFLCKLNREFLAFWI